MLDRRKFLKVGAALTAIPLIPSISAFIFMFAWTFIKARLLNKKNKNED